MQRLEKLLINVHKTNSVVKSYPTLSRYLCTGKSKDDGIKNLSEIPEENTVPVEDFDNLFENSDLDVEKNKGETKNNLSGFAKSYEKYTAPKPEEIKVQKTFAALLRHSKFIDLGEPEGKSIRGKIVHVVDQDIHVDFGWKFNCVCKRPARNADDYVRGSIVRLKLKSLELSTRFLGSSKDLTILEADCTLLGLVWSPLRAKNPASEISSEM